MNGQPEKAMAAYNSAYLAMIAGKYGGDTTLNEARVMNCIFRANLTGRKVGVSLISRAIRVPKTTVSRAVLKFRANGWIEEVPSQTDGRRRDLQITPKAMQRYQSEKLTLKQYWARAA